MCYVTVFLLQNTKLYDGGKEVILELNDLLARAVEAVAESFLLSIDNGTNHSEANSGPQTPELNKGEVEIQTGCKFRVGNMSIEIKSKAARLPSTTGSDVVGKVRGNDIFVCSSENGAWHHRDSQSLD
uniref:Uncharacterized protein n=1 Tax=Myotis myotis TaxID=51298 RepID=A0A7J7WHW4_MYOMY|nr:hypothetical protein mMyoMyo1_012117 [Myotis myotis]